MKIFSSIGRLRSYKNLKSEEPSQVAITASARARAPRPPSAQWLLTTAASAPPARASSRISASSAGESDLHIILSTCSSVYEDLRDSRKLVDSNDNLDTKLARVGDVPNEVLASFFECDQILFGVCLMQRLSGGHIRASSMHLQCSCRSDYDRSIRTESANTTLDVAEFFHAHVGAESTFSQDIADAIRRVTFLGTCKFESNTISENRWVSVSDVGEWSGVDKYRCTLNEQSEFSKTIDW